MGMNEKLPPEVTGPSSLRKWAKKKKAEREEKMAITKEQAVEVLYRAKEQLEQTSDKTEALTILAEAGKAVGYKPAFRALVMGTKPEDAIKWS